MLYRGSEIVNQRTVIAACADGTVVAVVIHARGFWHDRVLQILTVAERELKEVALIFASCVTLAVEVTTSISTRCASRCSSQPAPLRMPYGSVAKGWMPPNPIRHSTRTTTVKKNLLEYALGGVPTDGSDGSSLSPTSTHLEDAGTYWVDYVYRRRTDAATRGLSYETQHSGTLAPESWSSTGFTETSIAPIDSDFESATSRIIAEGIDQLFIRLEIKSSE